MTIYVEKAVPDPDLEIRGGPVIQTGGGGSLPKKFFRPFGSQLGLKISGDLGPSPGSATGKRELYGLI